MSGRDRVLFGPNQRVDLPDMNAVQGGLGSSIRRQLKHLLFGMGAGVYSTDRALQVLWAYSTTSTQITVTRGLAWVGETMDDNTIEVGHATGGDDGDSSQTLDFNGESAGTYYVYVRAAFDAGEPGSRIFWDASIEEEVAQATDTRAVSGWKVVYSSSSSPPDGRYTRVLKTVYSGTTHTVTPDGGLYLFEGLLNGSGVEQTGTRWGVGANDRNTDRAQYGVRSLLDFTSAVRRQLGDIIGASWFTAIPQSVRLSAAASLTLLRDHVDLAQDPHGSSLTQSVLLRVLSGGTLKSDGVLDVNGVADFAAEATFHDNIQMAGSGTDQLVRYTDAGDGSETGRLVVRSMCASAFTPDDVDASNIAWAFYRAAFYVNNNTVDQRFTIDLSDKFDGVELATEGPYINSIAITGSCANATVYDAIDWELERINMLTGGRQSLATGSIANTAFSLLPAASQVTLDISGASTAERKMTYPYVHRLNLLLKGAANAGGSGDYSPSVWGIQVGARHKYQHP